ncbi:MAG: glycosyltransferase family 4 protein [Anaerolineae bacterium]|nr:glycosyltransferase family 4 protein [Anaerolineae bacterium]
MKQRVCVVSQREIPGDARIHNQIQGFKEAGYEVDVLCTRQTNKPNFSVEDGVTYRRLPSIPRARASKIRYFLEYLSFWVPSFFALIYLQLTRQYQMVMVTNLPDPLVFSALFPKLVGAKVIFDIRECSPEMFNDRFNLAMDGKIMKVMIAFEQAAIRFSDATMTCTEQMKQAVIKRGAKAEKVFIMLNYGQFDLEPVLPDPNEDTSSEFRIITHGTIIKRYGHDILIKAMPYVLEKLPHARLEIMGKGEFRPELEALVKTLGLEDSVTFGGFVSKDELLRRLRRAYLGAVTIVRNPEADLVHTYKMFEYMAMGKPIVISRTTAAEYYFDDTMLCFFDAGSPQALADAIVDLAENPEKRLSLAKNALNGLERFSLEKQRQNVRQMIDYVLGRADAPRYVNAASS